MKKVSAIIRASKFEAVKEALSAVGVHFFSYYEVRGFGLQRGEQIKYRGAVYDMGYIARYKLEIILADEKIAEVVSAIKDNARTGEIGDGKIYVSNLEGVYRIRTGEEGNAAI
jgi:nitrogen regulatory protein PII